MGNQGMESLNDCETVQKSLDPLKKITSEFCEAEMRKKLNDCQDVRV